MNSKYINTPLSHSSSLLVIEPDDILKKGIAVALMDSFSEILTTTNPYEALRLVNEKQFTLIITEINFNTIHWREFLKQLRAANPNARLIVTSSILPDEPESIFAAFNIARLLVKPIEINSIIKEIIKPKE